jgi:hypothetical protein
MEKLTSSKPVKRSQNKGKTIIGIKDTFSWFTGLGINTFPIFALLSGNQEDGLRSGLAGCHRWQLVRRLAENDPGHCNGRV